MTPADCDLVWETFGWYVWRYYHYSRSVIEELQEQWTPERADLTLYENLKAMYDKLLGREVARRNRKDRNSLRPKLTKEAVEAELDKTRTLFIRSEREG